MNKLYYTDEAGLLTWLKSLAGQARLLAPRSQGPSVLFRPYKAEEIEDLAPMLRRTTASPKETILPRSEILVRFRAEKDPEDPGKLNQELEVPEMAQPSILFGGRPCDARGFVVLDRPYLQGKYVDPYYQARREATLIITQACTSARSACFCNWVGSNPSDAEGSDIIFNLLDGGYVFMAVSPAGEERLAAAGFKAGDDKAEALQAAQAAAAASLPLQAEMQDAQAKIAAIFQKEDFWHDHTVRCLSCGACTYLCPTCQCFTITDEGTALDGQRIRSWDSCMTNLFTMEASGHNPRGDKSKRMRQRLSHKFSYYPENYAGAYSCVGCGRCVVSCPASLDIRQLLAKALERAAESDSPATEAAKAQA